MTVRHMRLTMGLFFLVAGTGVLVLRFGMPDAAARFNSPTRLLVGGCLALVLAGLNLAKWYAGWMHARQMATPVRPPLQPNPDAPGTRERNPDFDFDTRNGPGN